MKNCAGTIVVQMFNDKDNVRADVLLSPTVQLTIEVYEHMVKVLQVSLKKVENLICGAPSDLFFSNIEFSLRF